MDCGWVMRVVDNVNCLSCPLKLEWMKDIIIHQRYYITDTLRNRSNIMIKAMS